MVTLLSRWRRDFTVGNLVMIAIAATLFVFQTFDDSKVEQKMADFQQEVRQVQQEVDSIQRRNDTVDIKRVDVWAKVAELEKKSAQQDSVLEHFSEYIKANEKNRLKVLRMIEKAPPSQLMDIMDTYKVEPLK